MSISQTKIQFQVPVALHQMVPKIEERIAKVGETSGAMVNVHADKLGFSQNAGANNIPFTGTVTGPSQAVENAMKGLSGIIASFS